jgi:hypothetical protein
MRRRLAAVLVLAAVLPAYAGTRLAKPPKGRGFQTRVGEYTIGPGEDIEVCEYRRLANTKPIDVVRFKLRMPPGAHHFAVWTYGGSETDDSKFAQGPVESVGCVGSAPDEFIPQLLIPTQSPNVGFRFPKGVALRLEAHQQVFLNPHMRNAGTEPVVPDVRFNLYAAKKGTVKHYAEGFTFGNSSDIKIPAGDDQTLVTEWAAPIDMTILQIATHQHRLGTYAKVELVELDGTRTLLVESYDWEHPRSVWPQGGLRVAKGRTLRLTCSWHNTEAHEVVFGPETTDEMCYGIGFFYRDAGDTTPVVGSGCIPSKKGLLCPLAPSLRE